MATLPTQRCKCGASVVYIRSARGRAMPHEPKPVTVTTLDGEAVRGWLKHTCPCPQFIAPGPAEPEQTKGEEEDGEAVS